MNSGKHADAFLLFQDGSMRKLYHIFLHVGYVFLSVWDTTAKFLTKEFPHEGETKWQLLHIDKICFYVHESPIQNLRSTGIPDYFTLADG